MSIAILVLLAGAWRWRMETPFRELRSVETQLAGAYAERRVFELRLPGAAYVPLQAKPGDTVSEFSKPVKLLEAESRIAHELLQDPENPQWLRLRARAEMLDQNFEEAVSTLQRAADARPDDTTLLADLGVAYALRATAGRNIDYSAAIEMLWRFLRTYPDSPVALFNRALVYERMYLFQDALDDWKHFLKLEQSGGWAEEARRHEQAIERKIATRREAMKALGDARAYREALKAGRANDAEFYLESAVSIWLPASATDADSREAMAALGRDLREKHGDGWVGDLLNRKPDERYWNANAHLAAAVKQNLAGDHELALKEAQEALTMYRSAANRAGELRAKYEEVYARFRSMQWKECASRADELVQEAGRLQYGWIATQALFERGNCRGASGEQAAEHADFEQALTQSRAKLYKTLELRALGLLDGDATLTGNQLAEWQQITNRLAAYWEAPYSPNRGHQFYSDLSTSAASLGHAYSAVILRRAAVEEVSKTSNRALEAQTRTIEAGLAGAADLTQEEDQEFSKASELFAQAHQTDILRRQHFSAEIFRAKALAQNAPDVALTQLAKTLPADGKLPSREIELAFYQTEGRAKLRKGDVEGAGAAFERAIQCNEQTLASLAAGVDRGGPLRKSADAYRGSVEIALDRRPEEAFRLWEWYRAGDLAGARRPFDPHAALPKLGSDAVLSYVQLSSGAVAVWDLKDGSLDRMRLQVRTDQLDPVVERFLRECSDPRSAMGPLRRDARQLYDWLIAPVAPRLPGATTLVLEADGMLGAIPFQALLDADGHYLGARFPIVVSRGLDSYERRRALKPLTHSSTALIVADPVLGSEMARTFPPLEGAAKEARKIAGLFAGSRLLSGKDATLEAVHSGRPDAELFHFAGHGVSEEADGGLLLAPSREDLAGAQLLKASKLAGEDWSGCALAVLSACSTGTGERNSFVNPESLVRGFLNAGVGRVVASRWNVDTAATTGFMWRFYESILSGALPSVALQRAAEALRAETSTAHPYYWAAFQLFGYK